MDHTWRHGRSIDLALTCAPAGDLNASGWRVRGVHSDSRYRYSTDAARTQFVDGRSRQRELLVGYGWSGEQASWSWYAGRTWAEAHEDDSVDLSLRGFKFTTSVFARPAESWRLFSTLSYARASQYTQFYTKLGHVANQGAFWGPEFKVEWRGGSPWDQVPSAWRTGLHYSGLRVAGIWWSLSLGRTQDHSIGAGGYLGAGAYTSF